MGLSVRSLNLLQAVLFVNKWHHLRVKSYPIFSLFLLPDKRFGLLLLTISMTAAFLAKPTLIMAGPNPPANGKNQVSQQILGTGTYGVTKNGELIAAANLDLPLIPASIIKLLTGLAALDQLGADYRFTTEFFTDARDNLYIKGYGDPYLVSEEVESIMLALKDSGIAIINDIYLDAGSYQLEAAADGTGDSLNPYDVAATALAVNFNTINVIIDEQGEISSGEPQTPLLPIMTRLGQSLPGGEQRINISGAPSDSILLAGQLFRSFQQKIGISGAGLIASHQAPPTKAIYTHYSSRTLAELLEGLLLYSNNFIANQIFLQLGAKKFGYPATWQKGRQAMDDFIKKDQILAASGINMVEGSGLSRKNRLTGRAMLRILDLFKTHAQLLPEKNGVLLKSGTLTGVYSYAGYFTSTGGLDGFTVILNQNKNNRAEILKIIEGIYKEAGADKTVARPDQP